MEVNILPSDSTVKSVWPHLKNQEKYIRGLYQIMRECKKTYGNAHVRIGVMGKGIMSYYRIFYLTAESVEEIFGSFYDNHKPFESAFAKTKSWSSESMDFDEIENFFIEVTGYKGPRPK